MSPINNPSGGKKIPNYQEKLKKDTLKEISESGIIEIIGEGEKIETPEMVEVTFPNENASVEVPMGSNLLDAAIAAGVFINSVCGGVGRCGKCKVIAQGHVKAEKSELITDVELKQGISLACTTKVLGPTDVHVPSASKVGIHQILTKCELVEIEKPDPLITKHFLKLKEPTLEDNISDLQRIKKSLKKSIKDKSIKKKTVIAPISVINKIPLMVREHDWKVTVTIANFDNYIEILNIEPGNTVGKNFGLCVDIGTTTIVIELLDLTTGTSLGCASNYNKQKICGEDVLSRIIYAEEHGVQKLQELVIENINYLISELTKNSQERPFEIDKDDISIIVLAGNTTMTQMLLGLDPSSIRREPYIPTANVIPFLKAREVKININPEALVYCLPCRSSWVGGDITADILASNLHKQKDLSMLIDVGTNGEVVLGNSDWMVTCSCSAGPAFEGGEVQFGMNASLGAIEKVQLTDDLNVKYKTIGNAPPKGICGSGLIDTMSELFFHHVIDRNGQFKKVDTPRLMEVDSEPVFVLAFANETGFEHKKDIFITETDIKNILRTKASVYAACHLLLKTLGYTFNNLKNIYIAGGFGNYLDTNKSILLGLFPDVEMDKYKFIGNGSLAGSYLALVSDDKRKEAEKIYQQMTYIELSVNVNFYNEFVSALFLPHTDLSLFPSVKEIV